MVRALRLQEYEEAPASLSHGKGGQGCGGAGSVKAEENAGVIDIGEGWGWLSRSSHTTTRANRAFRGGGHRGGGIVRDIFTMGARPVLLTNSLRFGSLDSPQVKRLFRGVVSGISHYGNCWGFPIWGDDILMIVTRAILWSTLFAPAYSGTKRFRKGLRRELETPSITWVRGPGEMGWASEFCLPRTDRGERRGSTGRSKRGSFHGKAPA